MSLLINRSFNIFKYTISATFLLIGKYWLYLFVILYFIASYLYYKVGDNHFGFICLICSIMLLFQDFMIKRLDNIKDEEQLSCNKFIFYTITGLLLSIVLLTGLSRICNNG